MNKIKILSIFVFLLFMTGHLLINGVTVHEKCIGLSNSFLKDAFIVSLAKDIILKTDGVTIKKSDLEDEINKNNDKIKYQLIKYKFFLLEQIATGKILTVVGVKELKKSKIKTDKMSDDEIIKTYVSSVTEKVSVTDSEMKNFYDENRSMMGGASFESLKPQLKEYLLNQKKQQKIFQVINNLGKYQKLEINQEWVISQCKIEKDNIVDKTRFNGKPSMIDFGSKGCVPCDMMTPILEKLENKYKNKINIVFVHVNEEQVLGAKFGIQSIPVQIFFDKNGNEVYRHTGFFSEEEIEKKFAQLEFK